MSFNEAVVRSNLAKVLNLIEDGLELIQEEYHLKNNVGTSGFIDILARDKSGHLVVIELKISKQSERDAITELFKYVALLKQTFSIKDSEIRLIVISTDWRELLVPFSEFTWNTSYNSFGYRAKVDFEGFPETIQSVQLLEQNAGRKIVPRHWIQCYEKKSERDIAARVYAQRIMDRGINNFVVLSFTYNYPRLNILGYGFYFAQQEESLIFYKKILERADAERYEEICSVTEDYADDEDILNEFADAATDGIFVKADEMEIGHPEKIKGYLQRGDWTVEHIERYGSFQRDSRLGDEQIINDICGFSGGSYTWFTATCKVENKSYLGEIVSRYSKCLYNNDVWRVFIRDAVEYFKTKPDGAVLHLTIFNPENIVESISLYERHADEAYLPKFMCVIETPSANELEFFYGKICVHGVARLNADELGRKYFDGSIANAPMYQHLHAIGEINSGIMTDLGLAPKIGYEIIKNGDSVHCGSNPRFRSKKVLFDDEPLEDLTVWLARNAVLAEEITGSYLSAVGGPLFDGL